MAYPFPFDKIPGYMNHLDPPDINPIITQIRQLGPPEFAFINLAMKNGKGYAQLVKKPEGKYLLAFSDDEEAAILGARMSRPCAQVVFSWGEIEELARNMKVDGVLCARNGESKVFPVD